jgi:hypothetical protein
MSRLPDLRTRLLELHKTLLDEQSRAYQAVHGRPVSGGELYRLLLQDEAFVWLRALSGLVARIDQALDDADDARAVPEAPFVEQARGLLRSEGHGPFETRYRDALQRSPDVVMAHAAVMKVIAAR